MSLFAIAFHYLYAKRSNTLLHIILMLLGVAMISALLLFAHQAKENLYRNSAGIDAVVGAKGSPLQLVLSTIQHMDVPTGNIKLSQMERIKRHPHIRLAIPISLGDNYQQFRIVGTEPHYLKHFRAEFAQGEIWKKPMQAVVGATVARKTGLKTGNHFIGVHGLTQSGHGHDDRPYRVVGILKATGTVLDRLIVTSLESVWELHALESQTQSQDLNKNTDHLEITALLLSYRNRSAALSFPRQINQQTSMQAASPVFEMARLINFIGVGTNTIFVFAGFLIAISLAGVLIGLLNNIRERAYDLAIFRTLGASRKKILWLVIIEGMTIAFTGSIIGLLLGHSMIAMMGSLTEKGLEMGLEGFFLLSEVWIVWGVILCLSFIVCLIPAWEAYKTEIRKMLMRF
ncbi:MAG: FtsX-like permease family protein [Pseudomonadota bacterium]